MVSRGGLKNVKNIADELMREGYIIKKPTHCGLQISLSPKLSREIRNLIKEMLGFDLG